MKVLIAGDGLVGSTVRKYIQTHTEHKVLISDPPKQMHCNFNEAAVVFISVPVPTKSFKQDISILLDVIDQCPNNIPIFVRSSVLPGTCDTLAECTGKDLCAFPEFLTARSAYSDFVSTTTHVVGIYDHIVHGDYNRILSTLDKCLPHKEFKAVSNSEAELIKFTHNCFGALKVTYFNGIYDLAKKHKCDYEVIKEWVPKVTGFISPQHMSVPGPDGERGFGGSCFPTNLAAMIGEVSPDRFYSLLESAYALNCQYRGTRDFEGIG